MKEQATVGGNIRRLRKKARMTQKELAAAIGKSFSSVQKYELDIATPPLTVIQKIADAFGVDRWEVIGFNNVDIPQNDDEFLSISNIERPDFYKAPLVGEIACGTPILAEENIEDYINVSASIKCDFVLRCKGDSMAPKLLDGDLVMIHKQDDVQEGQIAAVLVDTEATLKHIYRLPGNQGVQLVSDNPNYAPQVYLRENAQLVRILGLAVGYQRMI